MKTLIIADSHTHFDIVDDIIKLEKPDKVIHLGDYFDDFYDSVEDNVRAAEWLVEKIKDPNFVGLIGNHDLQYIFPDNRATHVTGFTFRKAMALQPILFPIARKLDWYYWLDNILLTHAGLNQDWLTQFKVKPSKKNISEILNKGIIYANRALASGDRHWFYNAGRARYGLEKVGGILWCDFFLEFKPIDGISQICGHTPSDETRKLGENYCIDTFLAEYLIYDGKTITVKKSGKTFRK